MSANLGTAWIQVKPSMNGVRGSILSGLRGTGSNFSNQFAGETRKSSFMTGAIAGIAAAATTKAIDFVTSSLKDFVGSASEIQSLRASFQSLTGSVGKTNKVMTTLYEFGKKTAFSNEEIQSAGRSFLAVGQNAKQMQESLSLAGDIAGATGANLTQLVLPLTQAFSRGKLQTQDFYQILNSGAGALRGTIVEAYKASGGVKELSEAMSDGEITTDILWDAMRRATKQGGFAFQGAIKQSETFNGRLSNLQEAFTNVGLGILGVNAITGEVKLGGPFDRLSKAVSTATEMLGKFNVNKIVDSFKNIDGGALGKTLGTKFAEALNNIGSFLGSVKWAEIGLAVGKQAVAFILGFFTGLLNFDVGPILEFAMKHWWEILLGIASIIFAPAKLFGPLVKGISKIPILGPMVAWVLTAIRGLGQKMFPQMTKFFAGLFSGAGKAIGTVFKTLGNILLAPFRLLDRGILAILNVTKGVITRIFAGIWNAIKFVFAPVTQFFSGIFNGAVLAIKLIFSGLVGALRGYFGLIRAAFSIALNGMKVVGGVIIGSLRSLFGTLLAPVRAVFGGIRNVAGAAFGAIRGAANTAWNIMKSGASKAWGAIRGVFGGVAGFFRGVFQSAYNGVAGVWNKIGGFFRGVYGKIKGAFDNVRNIGKNIVEGLWNGISDMAGWVKSKISGFSKSVLDGIKSFFKIKSPSRRLRYEVGRMLPRGIGLGIRDTTKAAVNAAQTSSRAIMSAFGMDSGFSTNMIPNSQLALAGAGSTQQFNITNPDPQQTAAIVASRMKGAI